MPAGPGGSRARLGLLVALALALVTVTWAPAAPAATAAPDGESSALHDPPWHAWRTETIDRRNIAINTEVATGPQGKVWITHGGESSKPLELAHREDGEWASELIPKSSFAPDGLAVDEGGRPWVAWGDSPEATVAARNASDDWWHVHPPNITTDPRVAFAPDGRLHVVGAEIPESGGFYLNHSSFDPAAPEAGWSTYQVTKGFLKDADIALGPDGTVHAVWEHNTDDTRHAEKPPDGDWHTTKSLPHCDWGRNAVDVDDEGRVHVACKANSKGLMYHLRHTNGTWTSEVANDGSSLVPERSPDELAFDTDLEVDDEGRPHIVYRTGFNGFNPDDPFNPELPIYTVKLADGSWHTKAIDRDGFGPGREVSLALDSEDRPQVGYIYSWRTRATGCTDIVSPCDPLRFAEPWAATVDRLANQAPLLAGS